MTVLAQKLSPFVFVSILTVVVSRQMLLQHFNITAKPPRTIFDQMNQADRDEFLNIYNDVKAKIAAEFPSDDVSKDVIRDKDGNIIKVDGIVPADFAQSSQSDLPIFTASKTTSTTATATTTLASAKVATSTFQTGSVFTSSQSSSNQPVGGSSDLAVAVDPTPTATPQPTPEPTVEPTPDPTPLPTRRPVAIYKPKPKFTSPPGQEKKAEVAGINTQPNAPVQTAAQVQSTPEQPPKQENYQEHKEESSHSSDHGNKHNK